MYFERPGYQNTADTLSAAARRARELGVTELVVATTTGSTALTAAEICQGMKIIAVSYHAGYRAPFQRSISDEARSRLEQLGVAVLCATHALSGVERGLAARIPGAYPLQIVAETLRLFGEGTKVAVEVAVMAADAGHLSGRPLIAVSGTTQGADTALVLTPADQSRFMDTRVHEIICKPGLFDASED